MAGYKTMDEIKAHVQKKINEALCGEISEIIKETASDIIQENVYQVYDPKVYERRGMNGGLASLDSTEVNLISDGTISIENVSEFNSGYGTQNSGSGLAGLVEFGNGYNGHRYDYIRDPNAAYIGPRPFMGDIMANMEYCFADVLIDSLAMRGIKVKK